MQALHDVVKAGWVRYIGMSSCWAYQCTSSYHTPHKDCSLTSTQSTRCRVSTYALHSAPDASEELAPRSVRDPEQAHALRLDAEPPLARLPRGGARDVPDTQGTLDNRSYRHTAYAETTCEVWENQEVREH